MKIGFIGAGKVGVTLGAYLQSKGKNVAGYSSKHFESAKTASEITSTIAYTEISELVDNCNMIFITTPDDQIAEVWKELRYCNIRGRMIIHTSGSLASSIFEEIDTLGAYGYSMHPMFSFHERNGNFDGLERVCFTIEGAPAKIDIVTEFIKNMGNRCLVADGGKKDLYHIANVIGSNLVLSLLYIGNECLSMSGVDMEDAVPAYMDLVQSNIDNIIRNGFVGALTGPIERNDIGTIERHLAVIPKKYAEIYSILSRKLIEIAQQKHPERNYEGIINSLHIFHTMARKEK